MRKGKAGFFCFSWIADYPDAESYLAMFYSKHGAPPNYTRFDRPAYDRLYERSLQIEDDSLRYALYHQMDSLVTTSAAVVPLFYDEVVRFSHIGIVNLAPNPLNLLELKMVRRIKQSLGN
jgi:peptide/nickel transport system substrate-binding protein